jgi:hypothetical protein
MATQITNMDEALAVIPAYLERNARQLAAQMVADGLTPRYSSKSHTAACGAVLAAILKGVDASAVNMTILFHSLANQSAWRQKFEGLGIFPEAEKKDKEGKLVDKAKSRLAKLTEEFGEVGAEEV